MLPRRVLTLLAGLSLLAAVMGMAGMSSAWARSFDSSGVSLLPARQVQLRALKVLLDEQLLPERIDAYQSDYQVLLPLGEISRMLALGITLDPGHGKAGGSLLRPEQTFALDLNESRVIIAGRELNFEPRLARVIDGEIYVSSQLLARWLPVELTVDLPTWRLTLVPRYPLSTQARRRHDQALAVLRPTQPAPRASPNEANMLVLQVLLDGQVLSDSFSAYQDGSQILLPLGELSRLLTLPIQVQAAQGSANGVVLREDRPFALSLGTSSATLSGRELNFEPRLAVVVGDDIYVSSQLLAHWLPLDLKIDLATLQLKVRPREKLPLQERLERERLAARLNSLAVVERPNYPYTPSSPGLIGVPMIDQSFGSQAQYGKNAAQTQSAYTAYLTSDLLYMEGSAYVYKSSNQTTPSLRVDLARHDPDANLLGPLHARSVVLGNMVLPSVNDVMMSSPSGNGVSVSNRPLDQPNSFDRHSLRGDLPPGWDVTVYYNDALLAYQASRPDGQYAFDDLPLSYGPNEFRLVFHGPLGQLRVERQSFLLDHASVQPGQLYYTVAGQYADDGSKRTVMQADIGLTKSLTGNVGVIQRPMMGSLQNLTFGQVGLQAYLNSMILTSELVGMQGGGTLGDVGLKTRLGGFSINLEHTQVQGNFQDDQYSDVAGGVRARDEFDLNGTYRSQNFPTLTLAVDALRNALDTGLENYQLGVRTAMMLRGTALSNSLRWQRTGDDGNVDGAFQVSRRVADIGVNAQVAYTVQPVRAVQGVALTFDHNLADGYQINGGVLHSLNTASSPQLTLGSAGFSKNFGNFGLAMNASYSSQRELALGMQLFIALDRDPRTGKWSLDGQPLAATGAVSARAFVDRNMNGIRDPGEEFVPNAGFILNGGGRLPQQTDASGTALLTRLAPGRYADIALDPSTLEDPQWVALNPGVRVLPRPGRIDTLEFPVVSTSEIEGTVYLIEPKNRRRGIGDARIELVDDKGKVIATCISSADGYYLLHQVLPGAHHVRIAPDQAERLKLDGSLDRIIDVPQDGTFISGEDLEFHLASR